MRSPDACASVARDAQILPRITKSPFVNFVNFVTFEFAAVGRFSKSQCALKG
jgi:hypothetical protein